MQEVADQLAAAGVDALAGVLHVVPFAHGALIGLAQLGADVDLGDAGLDAPGDVVVLDAGAAVQHQRDVQRVAQGLDVLDVQLGGGLFLVQQVVGDRAVHAAHGDAQPVALGLAHELHGLVHLGKAHLLGKDLLVGDRLLAGLVAHHRAQLGLHRDAGGVGKLRNRAGRVDVALQIQAGCVHHHGAVARVDGALDDRQVVDLLVVLVDHRHVVQVQQGVALHGVLGILIRDVLQAARLELLPLQARHLNHGHAVLIHYRLHDRLQHRRVRNVECRNHQTVLQSFANNNSRIHCNPPFGHVDHNRLSGMHLPEANVFCLLYQRLF